jgi:crotonobetainyl-CoA:carnitine CoA-transferase CaiB-like acyl-CoA transferase
VELLSRRGVPCTAVNAIDQVVREPQVVARDMVVSVEHPLAGTIRMAGLPVKMSETPGAVRTAAPLLGQHSEEILREVGYSSAEIEKLVAGGIVGSVQPVTV